MDDFDRGAERTEFVLETTKLLLDLAARDGFKIFRLGDPLRWTSRR